eukprot:CAMPEP_0176347896 /NCGR_PEP_ID=MMETSP0126-20121128/7437_1 /TAXON_ID=141414 ORGANISM="Strombidinopsis acuminatum, Strain SPMC142" /NCGR_SAMPLE_ID=MMETSP0126 /ASSEMBLY_ACC=CAM_ASM_000229 /LENGTH=234 /DNA_ID=CAMNT_0017696373 /DNA_START=97 /DNA_END=801 /DNA_ORIENTATION=-
MGRIAFYNIAENKDCVLSDSQPELVRGISHSEKGDNVYVSIGDVSCQRIHATNLSVLDNVLIVEDVDERSHKANCERSFTIAYRHYNCVITINMADKAEKNKVDPDAPSVSISNLETNRLEPYKEPELEFNQNTVPFDFDGERLLWMTYQPKGAREIFMYTFTQGQRDSILQFGAGDPIVSHFHMLGNKIYYVKNTKDIIEYDISTKAAKLIGSTTDAILALSVSSKTLREIDR